MTECFTNLGQLRVEKRCESEPLELLTGLGAKTGQNVQRAFHPLLGTEQLLKVARGWCPVLQKLRGPSHDCTARR